MQTTEEKHNSPSIYPKNSLGNIWQNNHMV